MVQCTNTNVLFEGEGLTNVICDDAATMTAMPDGIFAFSRVGRMTMAAVPVDPEAVVQVAPVVENTCA